MLIRLIYSLFGVLAERRPQNMSRHLCCFLPRLNVKLRASNFQYNLGWNSWSLVVDLVAMVLFPRSYITKKERNGRKQAKQRREYARAEGLTLGSRCSRDCALTFDDL